MSKTPRPKIGPSRQRSNAIVSAMVKAHGRFQPTFSDAPLQIHQCNRRAENCSALLMHLAAVYFGARGPSIKAKTAFMQGCAWSRGWVRHVAFPIFVASLVSKSLQNDELCAIVCALYPVHMPLFTDELQLPVGSAGCIQWTFRPWDWALGCVASCSCGRSVGFLSPQRQEEFVALPWFHSACRMLLDNPTTLSIFERSTHPKRRLRGKEAGRVLAASKG